MGGGSRTLASAGFKPEQGAKAQGIGWEEEISPTLLAGQEPAVCYTLKIRSGREGGGKGAPVQTDKSAPLATNNDQYLFQPVGLIDSIGGQAERGWEGETAPTLKATHYKMAPCVAYSVENHPAGSRVNINDSGKAQTLTSRMGTGGGNVPKVMEPKPVYCLQGNTIDRDAKQNGSGVCEDVSYTLNAVDRHSVSYIEKKTECLDVGFCNDYEETSHTRLTRMYKDPHLVTYPESAVRYIVRRLTPTECARLQGFADRWGDIDEKETFTQEEFQFWHEVRTTHAAINGKKVQEYTEAQMLTWYNKLHTDSAEYKMWGNGIALPPALYVLQGMAEAFEREVENDWML